MIARCEKERRRSYYYYINEDAEVRPLRIVMAAVIQSLQLNFECDANVSSTLTARRKELSWHNQIKLET